MPNLSVNISGYGDSPTFTTVTAADGVFTDDVTVGDDADVVNDLTAGTITSDSTLVATTTVSGTHFLGGNGSLANCTHSYTGDPNTGFYLSGADQQQFVAAGIAQVTVANGSTTFSSAVVKSAATYNAGYVTPAVIGANTDNYAPSGYATTGTLLLSASGAFNLTGIAAVANLSICLVNTSANTITLVHDATSTAANRFYCPGAVNFSLTQYSCVVVRYIPALAAGVGRWVIQS